MKFPDRHRRRSIALAVAVSLAVPLSLMPAANAAGSLNDADPTAAPGQFAEANLAQDRTDANFFYRIPALVHLGDGVVLASWDARPGSAADAPNPNSIVQRRSVDNGKTWGPMTTVAAGFPGSAAEGKYGYSDPSYVFDEESGNVFNFFVYSKDQGFHGSTWGHDDGNRQVISAAVVESSDGGETWSAPRLVTDVAKPGDGPVPGAVRSTFATSGAGIQVTRGDYKGRLIQQYAGDVVQANGSRTYQAYSVYSDDHGATWQRGEFTGTSMDENKVVELSDGRIMLNSRDSAGGGFRKVAISEDGGHSYSAVVQDRQLPDPTNNAHLTKMFPEAQAGSDDARKLLYTGANSQTGRENVSARVSCDDGKTWPGLRTIRRGFSAYSVATAMDDGRYGVFYEGSYTNSMDFASFDEDWLNYVCAPMSAPKFTADAGQTATMDVTITNQENHPVGGTLQVQGNSQVSSGQLSIDPIPAKEQRTVQLPVTAAAVANGRQQLQLQFTDSSGKMSQALVDAEITGKEVTGLDIKGQRADAGRDLAASPYQAGEKLPYTFTVKNAGNVNQWVVPTEGNFAPFAAQPVGQPSDAGNCRYSNLAAGASYSCATPRHTVTEAELSDGFFVPKTTWTAGKLNDYTTVLNDYVITSEEVDVLERRPALAAEAADPVVNDLDADGYASAGDTVTYTASVHNNGNVRLTSLHGAGWEAQELAAGERATVEITRTLSASDIEAGLLEAGTETLEGANGLRLATAELKLPALQLNVAPKDDATVKPGKAVLSDDNGHDTGLKDGDFTVTMNLWSGSNASQFILLEDGREIARKNLVPASPAAQQARVGIEGRKNGTYEYQGVLVNAAGSTKTAVLKVKVTDANPGTPVLSAKAGSSRGELTLTTDMWWGTNATSYQLFENGKLADSQELAAATPAAQHVVTVLSDRKPGTYEYQVKLGNDAGESSSKIRSVRVK
ncbi:exo-alpha-sialidase [Glutamicibacter protophormiae]|uniref:exo-alpha-sialidase n=1 Tax=Glutamicibacter protophormiae TaxID=37930 RepID=A0ABS4XML7_GLUPR|nr:exo-alpha-sialidase [Glutamicibacter protophormiae]MBP2397758.1 sialidase-1 [Glutamicibacter protophormiae]GGL86779.1 hypothetical protein GCM10010038_16020 [Glutamicibacter protophormiae]